MNDAQYETLNRNIFVGFIIIIFVILACFTIHSFAQKELHLAQQQKSAVIIDKIDSLRTEIKDYKSVSEYNQAKSDTTKIQLYDEQCRVDSLQDSMIDKLEKRTRLLLMDPNVQ
ncbi:MAG: hypothetical protein WC346_05890 [Methanogenium sp.]|jgi:hypothetical protein